MVTYGEEKAPVSSFPSADLDSQRTVCCLLSASFFSTQIFFSAVEKRNRRIKDVLRIGHFLNTCVKTELESNQR